MFFTVAFTVALSLLAVRTSAVTPAESTAVCDLASAASITCSNCSNPCIGCESWFVKCENVTSHVTQVSLDGRQLSALPASFSGLTFVNYLNLDRNSFTDLPAALQSLPLLTHLTIQNNPITAISSVGQLPTLTTL